jgi:hypothetical protein
MHEASGAYCDKGSKVTRTLALPAGKQAAEERL